MPLIVAGCLGRRVLANVGSCFTGRDDVLEPPRGHGSGQDAPDAQRPALQVHAYLLARREVGQHAGGGECSWIARGAAIRTTRSSCRSNGVHRAADVVDFCSANTAGVVSRPVPGGSQAGQGHISCTIITVDVQVCYAGFVLADGQINALASIPIAATTFAAAVIGGTGTYVGVSGQVNNVVTAPGVIDRTFELTFPEHH